MDFKKTIQPIGKSYKIKALLPITPILGFTQMPELNFFFVTTLRCNEVRIVIPFYKSAIRNTQTIFPRKTTSHAFLPIGFIRNIKARRRLFCLSVSKIDCIRLFRNLNPSLPFRNYFTTRIIQWLANPFFPQTKNCRILWIPSRIIAHLETIAKFALGFLRMIMGAVVILMLTSNK